MEQKENKILYIIIGILLLIIGIGAGYIIGTNKTDVKVEEKDKENKPKERTEEDKDNTKNQEERKDEEPPVKNDTEEKKEELASGTLESNGIKDSVEITLNGKKNTLLLENNKKEDGIIKFANTDIDLMIKYGAGPGVKDTTYKLNYNVVLGEDNKEYLVVSYGESYQQYLLILNDDTRIIGQYGTHYTNTKFYSNNDDCFVNLDGDKILYNVDGNDIFFYKYKEGSLKQTNSVTLEEVSIKINSNKITENLTGKTINTIVGQCS